MICIPWENIRKWQTHILLHICGKRTCVILKFSPHHIIYMNSFNDIIATNVMTMILFTCLNVLRITLKTVMMVLFTALSLLQIKTNICESTLCAPSSTKENLDLYHSFFFFSFLPPDVSEDLPLIIKLSKNFHCHQSQLNWWITGTSCLYYCHPSLSQWWLHLEFLSLGLVSYSLHFMSISTNRC